MKIINLIISGGILSMICCPSYAQSGIPDVNASIAYRDALQLSEMGHFAASGLSAESFEDYADVNERTTEWEQTTAQKLISNYFLAKEGTGEAIDKWLKEPNVYHRVSSMARRIRVLGANIKVKDGKYDEALDVYRTSELYLLSRREYEEATLCYAIASINAGDIETADALLQSLQGCKTHQMDMVYYSAYINYFKGKYRDAIADFGIVRNHSDYSSSVAIYLADCYLHTGEPEKALSILNNQLPIDILNSQEQNADKRYKDEINRIKGEAYYDIGNYNKAIQSLQQYCYNVETPRRTALYKLGMSLYNIQEYKTAAPVLSRSASTATDVMAQNAWLNAGISYVHSQNRKSAQIAFQQASEMTADTKMQEEALYNYALTLHEGNTMGFGESVGVFERFLNQFPKSQYAPSVAKHLTEVYFTTRNYKAALESINKIGNPSADILQAKQKVLYNLGVQEFINGNYKTSDTYTSQAIKLGSREAQYLKGESEYRQGKYSMATTDLNKYVEGNRGVNYIQGVYTLAYSLFKQKQYTAAKPYFKICTDKQTSKQANAQLTEGQYDDALCRYADCLYSERQYDDAYTLYQRVIDSNSSLADYAIYQQAFICGLRGNYNKKIELLSKLTGNGVPSNPLTASGNSPQIQTDALYEQGRALVQTGARQEALETFRRLATLYPNSQRARQAYNEMGLLYSEMGNTEAATNIYKQVINNYPNTSDAQTALANIKNIYTQQGKINEYAELAKKAGKNLSQAEFEQLISDAAVNSMNEGKYSDAYKYYDQLSQQTQSGSLSEIALEGKLRSAYKAKNYEATINAASQIIGDATLSHNLREEAQFYRAEAELALDKTQEAIKDLQQLSERNQTLYGAQANVRLAQYAFETNQYQAAEQLLSKFIDSGTSQQYWLARAFIVLSDVYAKTDRKVEAKEYLLSLKSNYNENEEINQMIAERLAKLQ
ncbi:MAG: tetratricopeptide repeat protein [Bacteroidaceae bacterium]|nr:tetratricopeptide repeat protein [Bacteroidaceae bacterium]